MRLRGAGFPVFFGKSCLTECLPDTEQLLSFQLKQFADFKSNIVQRTMCRSSPWLLTSRRASSSCGSTACTQITAAPYVKKPMPQCSGEEIMRKFLYYCGLEDKIDEIMPHITAIPVVMPYITSQFMPRKLKDRARRSFQRATGTSRSSAGSWSWRAMWCHCGNLCPHGDDRRLPDAAP